VLSDESFNAICGTTDSEHFFALLCDEIAKSGPDPGSRELADALNRMRLATQLMVERMRNRMR
jgi:predicted glutamine amidotransferase